MPSRAAAKRYLHLQAGPPLCEPGLTPERLDGIVDFYERLGYKGRVFYIAHDATACLPRLRYVSANNTLVGIAVSDDDLPRTVFCAPDTYDEILDLVQRHDLATQVELYCLKPSCHSVPPYIVALFLQLSTPSADNVQRRLRTIVSYLASRHGIAVLGYSADGAPPHLKAMESLQFVRLPLCLSLMHLCSCAEVTNEERANSAVFEIRDVPALSGTRSICVPAASVHLRLGGEELRLRLPMICVQDVPHLANKLRNRLLVSLLLLGNEWLSLAPLYRLLSDAHFAASLESRFKLRRQDLKPDRMDFKAAQRLFAGPLIARLQQCCASPQQCARDQHELRLLTLYLRVGSAVISSYLDPSLHPYVRIERAFFAAAFVEGWLADLNSKRTNVRVNAVFITQNSYRSIRLNATSLLLYTFLFTTNPQLRRSTSFMPEALTSIMVEHLWREARQAGNGNVNFDFIELVERLMRNEAYLSIRTRREGSEFFFPRFRKHWELDERQHQQAHSFPTDISTDGLLQAVSCGIDDARAALALANIEVVAEGVDTADESLDIDNERIDRSQVCRSLGGGF